MAENRDAKVLRHQRLTEDLGRDPFVTDEELAHRFHVSVQTIRLDRLAMGIPELRQRTRQLASEAFDGVVSLSREELIGELVDLEPGRWGVSLLTASPEMAFARRDVIRGHFLFAQANSLAVAVVPSSVALTRDAEVHFLSPVLVGERLIARAEVQQVEGRRYHLQVSTRRRGEEVFCGRYVVVAVDDSDSTEDI